MTLIDEFIKSFETLKSEFDANANSRYLSWEYCYESFKSSFSKLNDLEESDFLCLSLQLAFYLASWGMYRGSSFLLQFDYKIHLETVKLILQKSPLLHMTDEPGLDDIIRRPRIRGRKRFPAEAD